ncbi:MAG TPA: histidine kinase [Pontibacter sp.]
MSDTILIIATGTALLLTLGAFISFMTLAYQKKRQLHAEEVSSLVEAYQKEILKAQLEMQEQTFLSISQEIHDNVGQVLSLVRLNISTLENAAKESATQKITTSKELLDQAIQDLRDLSKRLNSNYLAQQSLSELLRFQLGLIGKTGAVDTSFEVVGNEWGLEPEKKLIIFRIAQEALSNILRHADADAISSRLVCYPDKMTLNIADNGKGFQVAGHTAANGQPNGTGTLNMRYRARLIGASLHIESTPEAGTVVSLELPNP